MKHTEQTIQKALVASTDWRKYPFQCANCFIYGWECDFWTLDDKGFTREFEIKITAADFRNDAKKQKHMTSNGANYFYYVCPEYLIKKEEIDKKYGLVYVNNFGSTRLEKSPKLLHDNMFSDYKMLAIKYYYKWVTLWKEKYFKHEITLEQFHEARYVDFSEIILNK